MSLFILSLLYLKKLFRSLSFSLIQLTLAKLCRLLNISAKMQALSKHLSKSLYMCEHCCHCLKHPEDRTRSSHSADMEKTLFHVQQDCFQSSLTSSLQDCSWKNTKLDEPREVWRSLSAARKVSHTSSHQLSFFT